MAVLLVDNSHLQLESHLGTLDITLESSLAISERITSTMEAALTPKSCVATISNQDIVGLDHTPSQVPCSSPRFIQVSTCSCLTFNDIGL